MAVQEAERLRAQVRKLVEELETAVSQSEESGMQEGIANEEIQRLLTLAVKLYAAKWEEDVRFDPFPEKNHLMATEVVLTVSEMLKAARVELFEVGMWQSWAKS